MVLPQAPVLYVKIEVKRVRADTIAAIATATAPAGIGVVRISGSAACEVADSVFSAVSGKKIAELDGYNAAFGCVTTESGIIDEAVALRFKAPHSYTGEDVVELSCHGGPYIMRRVLRAVLDAGARLAEAGEFTRRAFENGKLDLTSAEAVMDLIGAQNEQSHLAALSAKEGAMFRSVCKIRDIFVNCAADLAAWVDFPDEDVPAVDNESLKTRLSEAISQLDRLISTAEQGKILKDGVKTVIVGKPNVGKSTIMNLLSKQDMSIVTDMPGTTRDAIEDTVNVGGVMLRLADTAGIRSTDDPVEAIGVELALKHLSSAALIIAVFDLSRPLDSDDFAILEKIKGRSAVILLNKADLEPKFEPDDLKTDIESIAISAKHDSADNIESVIAKAVGLDKLDASGAIIANERQLDCARRSLRAALDAVKAIEVGFTLDAVGVCIDDALAALAELTGECVSQSVVDDVFSRFCVGK